MRPDRFTHFLAIDWSGAKGERQRGIALSLADAAGGPPVLVERGRGWSREEVADIITHEVPRDTLIGMDLGIALPFADAGAYFPGWDDSPADAKALWALIDDICAADPHLKCGSFIAHTQASRYFRHSREHVGDRFLLSDAPTREGRFRVAEAAQRAQGVRPVSNFNLVGAAQVGKSSLTGMRMLHRLRDRVSVWPIDPLPECGPVVVEMYTSIAARGGGVIGTKTKLRTYEDLNAALVQLGSPPVPGEGTIDDHSSDALLTAAWLRTVGHDPAYWNPAGLTPEIARTEGWTFGAL
ncbi:hypothetical protein [Erythrobacter litoralis]|uniref:DUF429 domain-containing protein n=1 Tax=Erythrobacter litoralis (strain HTCC2594) TaxID=314225 RepID=Q2NCW3_ERYLH|nr:hypothetical protein [Erythrobacter litoralis]ABC62478.1 hypothetical protein ELI_01930 [Erythrobacter litoralis HTCC2594]